MIRDSYRLTATAAVKLRMTAGDKSAEYAFPVTSVKPDPAVWAYALALADGDVSRLHIDVDGSVTVSNTSRWRPAS